MPIRTPGRPNKGRQKRAARTASRPRPVDRRIPGARNAYWDKQLGIYVMDPGNQGSAWLRILI
jgi:hypothetical protein